MVKTALKYEPDHVDTPNRDKKPEEVQSPPAMASGSWYILLVLPYLGLLRPAIYDRTDPQLLGFPFFYWYQFAWVFVSAILTGIVYLAVERRWSHG